MICSPRFRPYFLIENIFACLNLLQEIIGQKNQKNNKLFCKKLSRLTEKKYILTLPQGRIGIFLAIQHICKNNPKANIVLCSPYTIYDVINMIILAGGQPKFCDINEKSLNIDPNQIKKNISNKVAAVLVTHLHGQTAAINEIQKICRPYQIPIVEDCAQCFGAFKDKRALGSFGEYSVFSFGLAKNINCISGGALCIKKENDFFEIQKAWSPKITKISLAYLKKLKLSLISFFVTNNVLFNLFFFKIFKLGEIHDIDFIKNRWRGEDEPVLKTEWPKSYNGRFYDFQAKVGLDQLNQIQKNTHLRIRHAKIYFKGLQSNKKIKLPPRPNGLQNIYLSFPIQVKNRSSVIKKLFQNNRDIAIQHIGNCASYKCFKKFKAKCKYSEKAGRSVILLPTYPMYPEKEIIKNINVINSILINK